MELSSISVSLNFIVRWNGRKKSAIRSLESFMQERLIGQASIEVVYEVATIWSGLKGNNMAVLIVES